MKSNSNRIKLNTFNCVIDNFRSDENTKSKLDSAEYAN